MGRWIRSVCFYPSCVSEEWTKGSCDHVPANNTGETWGFMIVVVAAMVVVAAKASEQAKQALAHKRSKHRNGWPDWL